MPLTQPKVCGVCGRTWPNVKSGRGATSCAAAGSAVPAVQTAKPIDSATRRWSARQARRRSISAVLLPHPEGRQLTIGTATAERRCRGEPHSCARETPTCAPSGNEPVLVEERGDRPAYHFVTR